MYTVFRLKSWCEYNIDMNIPGEAGTGMLEILNIFQLKIDHIFLGLTLIFSTTPSKAGYSASILIIRQEAYFSKPKGSGTPEPI